MYRLANNSISSSISYRRNIKTILGRSRISLEHVGHRFQYSSIKHDPNKILIIETSENNIKSYYIKDDKGAKHISEEKDGHPSKTRFMALLRSCFLPDGYPKTVSNDYKYYYAWTALQGISGSATYVLSTKALLVSVGVSSTVAIPGAAAISWVLKDGLGSLGMMAVASKLGTRFDSDTKRNKWRGDILHNVGVGLELSTPLFPQFFLFLASLANVAKGLAGIIGGATRASLNKHFSQSENLGDITAKAQTQGIATYLTGMSLGIGLSMIPFNTPGSIPVFITFGALAAVHIYASYRALSSVSLRTLNFQRTSLLIDEYIKSNTISTPETLKDVEKIVATPKHFLNPKIVLGARIAEAFENSLDNLEKIIGIFKKEKFLFNLSKDTIYVVLHEEAQSLDSLKAFFSAYYLRNALLEHCRSTQTKISSMSEFWSNVNNEAIVKTWINDSLHFAHQHFHSFVKLLGSNSWNTEHLLLWDLKHRANWTSQ